MFQNFNMMDPPIKLFGQTIAKAASSAFTTSSGEGEDKEGAPTSSSGGWCGVPFSSQGPEVKENATDNSVAGEVDGSGPPCTIQDSRAGSLPDLTSSASNSAEEEKLCVSPRGEAGGGSRGADESRSVHLTPPASQGDGGGGDDENSEDEDGSQPNGRGKKDGAGGENDMGKGGDKMHRRPENAVACPRCHSLETKFCYYNNYNVNQPRHFCKHCQRYWTAGGTLRNVPVGAGRRKNKHGSTIAPRGQTPEVGTVRSDAPDIASPLIVTKGVFPVPIQVSVVQGGGTKAGVMRMAVPGNSDPSVLPFLRMQPQQMDPASIFKTSEPGTSGDTATVACKRSRLATPGYSDASTGGNDMEQHQHSQVGWGQQASITEDESACSPITPTSNNIVVHEIKGEAGAGCPMIGVAPAPVLPVQVGGPDQQHHHPANNTTVAGRGAWSGAGPQATVLPPGAAAGPFGFYNGGWPYGYNVGVGWSGPPAFCAGGVPPTGTPGVTGPPPPGNIAAAWNGTTGSVWTGVPWPMPGLAWGPPWAMAPWAMSPGPGGVSMGPMTQTIPMSSGGAAGIHTAPCSMTAAATGLASAAAPTSPSSSLGKHSRGGPPSAAPHTRDGAGCGGSGRMEGNGCLWAPKSLRMADPEEAVRSSVWRILGVGNRPDMTTGSTFRAFQPRNESKKIADDDQQAAQAALHANPAAMSRSMNFHESN